MERQAKTSKEKEGKTMEKDYSIPHPQYEDTPAALYNVRQSKDENGMIWLHRSNDTSYSIYGGDFFDAFNILISDEFDSYLIAYERKNETFDLMHDAYNACYAEIDKDKLYEAVHSAKRYGRWHGIFDERQEQLVTRAGWDTLYNACMLYEVLYGVDHSELI